MSPLAFLLTRPQFELAHVKFLEAFYRSNEPTWRQDSDATPAERLVEFAGRVCYMSFGPKQSPKTNREYIRNLIKNGHESVLEHATWTFAVCGVSRAFTHQLVRHRVGFAFSQLSQQYHDESEATFIAPSGLDRFPASMAAWEAAVMQASTAYKTLIKDLSSEQSNPNIPASEKQRLLRTAARSVLPNATETAIVFTANARALRHFFRVRGGIVGDIEMRCVASAILELVQPEGPALFSDFRSETFSDGLPIVIENESCDN